MSCPLGILAPDVGLGPATFIRRHARDLLPGRTAVVARATFPASQPVEWSVDGPLLDLARVIGGRLRWQVIQGAAKRVGFRLDRRMITAFLRRHRVQAVMGEYLDFSLEWLDAVRPAGVRFFAHAHGHDINDRLREHRWRQEYLRYNETGGIITVHRRSREELIGLGIHPAKVQVIYSGVDVPSTPPPRPDHGEIRCIAVGRVVQEKAPILVLDSFRRAVGAAANLRLDYAGDGPLLPAVRDFLLAFELGERVVLHGHVHHREIPNLLARADIFLQHSRQEGLSVAVLEAMACALPVVATAAGGNPEAVVEGVTGYLVEPGDTAGMAERIVALARDPDLRRRMGLAGWQRAREMFTWERERAELLRVLGLSEA